MTARPMRPKSAEVGIGGEESESRVGNQSRGVLRTALALVGGRRFGLSRSGRDRWLDPWRRSATQQTFGVQVFIDVRPVDAIASPGNLPVVALFPSRVEEARIPR